MSKKALTEKDVLYAIQYGGQRLVSSVDPSRRPALQYHLQPSGVRVPSGIANRLPNVERSDA